MIDNQLIMNNLGGYRTIELIFVDELSNWAASRSEVRLETTREEARILPTRDNTATLNATPSEDEQGTVWAHQAEVSLRAKSLTPTIMADLEQVTVRGCVLRAVTFGGEVKVLGDKLYPLRGSFVEDDGTKLTDLHHYILSLSCNCLHPMLRQLD